MSEQDIVQEQIVNITDYSIAATVLTNNVQRGFGVLTRTGVGTLRITLPAGKGIPNNRCKVHWVAKEAVAGMAIRFEPTSTDLLKDFTILNDLGAAIDNVDGIITLSRVL